MKNLRLILSVAFMSVTVCSFAQSNFYDNLKDATVAGKSKLTGLPNFIKFLPGTNMTEAKLIPWMESTFNLDPAISFKAYSTEPDGIGMTHIRYREYIGNFPVDNTMIIAHIQNGEVVSVSTDFYREVNPALSASITEQVALQDALNKVNAVHYKWENKTEEQQLRIIKKDPTFTFFPKGSLVFIHKKDADYSSASIRLAWKFDIYADQPLSRAYIYVDAQTGEVIAQQEEIHTADVLGTAHTVYSGVKPMTSDNFATNNYRLRETGRGNGIETYNMNNTTNYTQTDFTNSSSTWNTSPPDQAATDAHWGAEMTYDYFMNVHGRNSIDNAGFALLSYVHYDVNFVNAFWDGQEMTYGDGDVSQGYTIMTGLDVCGHEISHGLTTFT
ncbi:MAG TPA: hypothetical protein VFJ43_16935, partial [Bacteroidia bacterium]|nr:hypothetical protein [Bacteroidia bacterium]